MFRLIALIVTKLIYKVRFRGLENLPNEGPALLVANHVSFLDTFFIQSIFPKRKIVFLMHEDYYRHWVMRLISHLSRFIKIHPLESQEMIDKTNNHIKQALTDGEVVCVFPEGKITRNGIVSEFKSGVGHLIPSDLSIPVIPIAISMIWGSMWSYYFGKITFRLPHEFPIFVSLTAGSAVPKESDSFTLRQTIAGLIADAEIHRRPKEQTIITHFAKSAHLRPFCKSFIDYKGVRLSNFQMYLRALVMRKLFSRLLIKDSEQVGILLPNMTGTVAVILATMMNDKIPAMLNYTTSDETIDKALNNADVKQIITSRKFLGKVKLKERENMIILEDLVPHISKWYKLQSLLLAIFIPGKTLMKKLAPLTYDDVFRTATIIFSSGTTGTPKGVMLSHHNINANLNSLTRVIGLRRQECILGNLPLFHSFGFAGCFWLPIIKGASIAYITNPIDAQATCNVIEKEKVSFLLATPTFLQSYMRKYKPGQFDSLRLVITGAERLKKEIADNFILKTGVTVTEGYGCTELSPVVSINVGSSILDLGKRTGKEGSIGVAMPGIQVKIVHPDTKKELPPGEEGLLLVRGANVMKGYINNQKKTNEVITDGWYNTGDIVTIDTNGYMTITGRLSRFSKIAGEMVPHELLEQRIEEIVSSDERLIVVCGAPDKTKGEKLIVFYKSDAGINPETVVNSLKSFDLPALWLPKKQNFHAVDTFPLLGSGKVNLKEIQNIAVSL